MQLQHRKATMQGYSSDDAKPNRSQHRTGCVRKPRPSAYLAHVGVFV